MPSNAEALSRMESDSAAAKIERGVAKAAAKREASRLRAVEVDDVLTSETKSAVKGLGLGSEKVKAAGGADKMVMLYHAYDGRAVPVPSYMLERRLSDVFIEGMEVPDEFLGDRVWYGEPQPIIGPDRIYLCRLSKRASAEMSAEMQAAGLALMCRKPGAFATQFEADEHFRIKHRRRWEAWQRHLTASREEANAGAVPDFIKQLAEQMASLKGSTA